VTQIQLRPGDPAPQFRMEDALGHAVSLQDYKNKHVLLVFLRYSGCPLCNLSIHRLTMEYPMLSRNGCEVIAFVQSDAPAIKKHIYDRHKNRPQYPIIGDNQRKLYKKYGVRSSIRAAVLSIKDIPYWIKSAYGLNFKQTEIDGDLLLVPALFLVAPDTQTIVTADYGTSFYDHQTFTKIYEPLIFK
jgi:peroxiredoxin